MDSKMRALSLFAGTLLISGSICLTPPQAKADADPPSQAVDTQPHQAAEPTSLSTSTVLGICILIAWRVRRGRTD
jgi:hypothetical protein